MPKRGPAPKTAATPATPAAAAAGGLAGRALGGVDRTRPRARGVAAGRAEGR